MEQKNSDELAVFTTISTASDRQSWLFSLLGQIRESYEAYRNPPAPVHVTAEPDPEAVGLLIEQPSALGSMVGSIRGMIEDWRNPHKYDIEPAEVQEIWGGRRYKTQIFSFVAYAALIGVAYAVPRAVKGASVGDETVIPIAMLADKVILAAPPEPKPAPKAQPKPPTNPKPSTVSGGGETPKRSVDIPPPPKPAPPDAGGGGGGGRQELTEASKGLPPVFRDKQFVPPTITVMNDKPLLPMEQTLVARNAEIYNLSNIKNPSVIGDPLGVPNAPPSAGTGKGAGIGSGTGNGVGAGTGAGLGPGSGGGTGGGDQGMIAGGTGRPCIGANCGNGGGTRGSITEPAILRSTKPPYSEDARKNKVQGTVILDIVVREDGTVDRTNIKLVRKQGYGLDESAIEDVKGWLFKPATQDGRPIARSVRIEVNFALR